MRFRKSIKIAPGLKINFSKSGISSTIGGKGLSVNIGSRGTYLNTGIPGTGISNRTKLDGKTERNNKARRLQNIAETTEPIEAFEPTEKIKPVKQKLPLDISKAKKRRKRLLIAAIIFGILGLLSIPTVIWAIVYLLVSAFLFLAWKGTSILIKEAETTQVKNEPAIEPTS
jgi:hypothetical protein